MREIRYAGIFNDFLNGKFDKNELLKRMDIADKKTIDGSDLIFSVSMVHLKSKSRKPDRLVSVD